MVFIERVLILVTGLLIGALFSPEISTLFNEEISKKNDSKTENIVDPGSRLSKMIETDFELLDLQDELPAEWRSIATIQTVSTSKTSENILKTSTPKFPIIKNGKYLLELVYIYYSDEEGTGFIIQSSFIETKSKNKIWEIARSYNLPQI